MNSLIKIGILTSAYIGYDLLTALDHISGIGFEYVEISAVDGALEHVTQEELTLKNAKKLRQELNKRGLEVNAMAAHIKLTNDNAVERFLPRLRFAADIGSPVCVTGSGPVGKIASFKKNLEVLVKEAEKLKVVIALETNADIILTGKQGLGVVEEFNSPWLGINYDAGNVLRGTNGTADIGQDFSAVVQQIKHVHIKDLVKEGDKWRFCLPGKGIVKMDEFLKILSKRKESISANIELPYQYRFSELNTPISKLEEVPALDFIDKEMASCLKMLKSSL